jgi:hypothetical protein
MAIFGVSAALLGLFIVLFMWIAPIWISVHLGNAKGQPLLGWLLGLVLGWIGVIIMLIVPPSLEAQRREALAAGFPCPYCREPVRYGAIVCPHCRRDLKPAGPA